jgi:cobalt-zinc-cadmium efflux system outer membrane protein
MNTTILIRYLSCFLLVIAAPSKSAELALTAYTNEVLQSNPSLASMQSRLTAAKAATSFAGALDDPVLSVGLEDVPTSGEDMSSMRRYELAQIIPFPGKRGKREDIAEKEAAVAEANVYTTERELKVLATQIYYRALYNQNAQKLNHDLRSLIQTQLSSSRSQYKLGEGTHHDWLVLKVLMGTLDVESSRLKRESLSLQALFNELRGREPGASLPALVLEESQATNEEPETLLQAQPELKSLRALEEAAKLRTSLSRLSYLPDFMIEGMYMEPRAEMAEEKPTWGFMIGLSLPLYFPVKQSRQVEASEALQTASNKDQEALMNRLRTEIIDAREQLHSAQDIVKLYQSVVLPDTQLAVQSAKSGYAARRLAITEYLNAMKTNRQLQLELLAAQIDVELAKTRIRELISSPPLLRLAPSKPSVFGSGAMGSDMGMDAGSSPAMQLGMSRTTGASAREPANPGSSTGMGNM